MGKSIILLCLFIASCGVPPARIGEKLQYTAYLHANSCQAGASVITYQNVKYPIGDKSTDDLESFVSAVQNGAATFAEPVGEANCEKVYRIEFSGDFEKEKNLDGYNGEETRQVVQIYSFRLL